MKDRKAVVISDDDRLARAIALVLDRCLDVESIELGPGSSQQWKSTEGDVDLELIVLALSSADSEPLALLSRASPGAKIGQGPVLIVSDRTFFPDLGDKVFQVDFPYDPHKLCKKASEILQENLP